MPANGIQIEYIYNYRGLNQDQRIAAIQLLTDCEGDCTDAFELVLCHANFWAQFPLARQHEVYRTGDDYDTWTWWVAIIGIFRNMIVNQIGTPELAAGSHQGRSGWVRSAEGQNHLEWISMQEQAEFRDDNTNEIGLGGLAGTDCDFNGNVVSVENAVMSVERPSSDRNTPTIDAVFVEPVAASIEEILRRQVAAIIDDPESRDPQVDPAASRIGNLQVAINQIRQMIPHDAPDLIETFNILLEGVNTLIEEITEPDELSEETMQRNRQRFNSQLEQLRDMRDQGVPASLADAVEAEIRTAQCQYNALEPHPVEEEPHPGEELREMQAAVRALRTSVSGRPGRRVRRASERLPYLYGERSEALGVAFGSDVDGPTQGYEMDEGEDEHCGDPDCDQCS